MKLGDGMNKEASPELKEEPNLEIFVGSGNVF